jgi:hypothetical protein
MKSRVIVAIYTDADFYPPTINAILNLSEVFKEVVVICRNNAAKDFPYPTNVRLKKIGPNCTVREMEKQSIIRKSFYFVQFFFSFLTYSKKADTQLLLIYDSFALFACFLMRPFIKNKKIWYHNHDMVNKALISSFSIGRLAAKFETRAMKNIDFFSLPSKERLVYFPDLPNHIRVFIIPNYPSLKVYKTFEKNKTLGTHIAIIYQGFIGPGHSLEELTSLLSEKINGLALQLILKGSVTDSYRLSIETLASENGVEQQITWIPIGPYSELPVITSQADIGIGINKNTDIVSLAQGTASNKIYEYAASGLPVVLHKSEQFEKYLASYNWAFFSDGSVESLRKTIVQIVNNLENLSVSARNDFENRLNFEQVFQPVMKQVVAALPVIKN